MNFTTAPLSWHWGIIFIVCAVGAITVGRSSRWYPYFWWPLLTLGGICSITLYKSWGAGPRDGPSGLVILFAVLPVVIVSILGLISGMICLWKYPVSNGAKPVPMISAASLSTLALFITIRSEMRPLSVRVLDGNGKPVSGITVDARAIDEMTYETIKQKVTDRNGFAHFEFPRFRLIGVSATARNHCLTRATYGETGYVGTGWKISSGNSSGYMIFDRAFDPTTVDLHLRGTNDFVLPDLKRRLAESIRNLEGHNARYALAGLGSSFENFEMMDQIRDHAARRGSYDRFLSNQAELLVNCFKTLDSKLPRNERRFFRINDRALGPSGWQGLARWAGIAGDEIPATPENLRIVDQHLISLAERLLDDAKPMLGIESSTAGVYEKLGFVAMHRLPDLVGAFGTAVPRAKRMILFALEDFKPGFKDLESLIVQSEPLEALGLLRCIGKWIDRKDFDHAKRFFEKLDSLPHPEPEANAPFNYVEQAYQSTRKFFEEEEKRWVAPRENR